MVNNVIFIKYISIVVLSYLSFSACKSGINVDSLSVPSDILEDATESYFKADIAEVNKNYAEIDTGESVPVDGYTISEPTDAERIINAATKEPLHIFIELPADAAKSEHTLRSLSAASIRWTLNKSRAGRLLTLNTKAITKRALELNLNDEQTTAYFLSVAKKINETVSGDDAIIIDLDDLKVTPKEFMEFFNKPHIIGLSHKSVDYFAPFSPAPHQEFLAMGLNPGHVYKMTENFMKRYDASLDQAAKDKLILTVSKLLAALEPNTRLGSLAKIYSQIKNTIDKDPKNPSLESEVIKDIAGHYETSVKFINGLDLDKRTLTDIQDKTKENVLAFSESARKLDRVYKMTSLIKSITTPGLDDIKRVMTQTKGSLEDLRSFDLPEMQRELTEQVGSNRDDLVAATAKEIRRQVERMIEDNKLRHDNTRNLVRHDTKTITNASAENTRSLVSADVADKIEDMTSVYGDYVKAAIKKIHAGNKDDLKNATKTMGNEINAAVGKARNALMDALAQAEQEVKKTMGDEHTLTRDAYAHALKKYLANSEDAIKGHVTNEHTTTKGHVTTEHGTTKAHVTTERDDIKTHVTNEHGITKGKIGETSTQITKLRQILLDALTQAEQEVKKTMGDEHTLTRDAYAHALKKYLANSEGAIKGHVTNEHTATKTLVTNEHTTTKAHVTNEHATTKGHVTTERDDIKTHVTTEHGTTKAALSGKFGETSTQITKLRQILLDALTQAEQEVKKTMGDEHTLTRDAYAHALKKYLAHSEGAIKGHVTNEHTATKAHVTNEHATSKVHETTEHGTTKGHITAEHAATQGRIQAAIKKQGQQIVDATRDAVTEEIDQKISLMGQTIDQRIKSFLARIIDGQKKQTQEVNDATRNIVVKQHNLTNDQIREAQLKLVEIVQEEASNTIDTIAQKLAKMPPRLRRDNADIARKLARAVVGYILGRSFIPMVPNTWEDVSMSASIPLNVAQFNNKIKSIEEAPRFDFDKEDQFSDAVVDVEKILALALSKPSFKQARLMLGLKNYLQELVSN